MIDRLLASVRKHWEELGLERPIPHEFQCLLQSRRRVIVFLFDRRGGRTPVAVAKISRDWRQNGVLEKSVNQLRAVRARLAGTDLVYTLPGAVLLDPLSGLSAALETCVPGHPMAIQTALLGASLHHRRNFAAWREWLVRFQRATSAGAGRVGSGPDSEIASPAPGAVDALARRLEDVRVPIAWRFGDAHHSNILLGGGHVTGVVDWEGCAPEEWVLNDWLHFVFQYLVELGSVRNPRVPRNTLAQEAFASMLRRPVSRLDEIVQTETATFLTAWDLNPDMLPAYVALFAHRLYWCEGKDELLSGLSEMLERDGWSDR